MAQVDFYQLSRDPAERVAVLLARKLFEAGDRLLIVAQDETLRTRLSEALWAADGAVFLAHEMVGAGDDAVQPILLSAEPKATNGARHIMLADGEWRAEALSAERVFYLFGPDRLDEARAAWKSLKDAADLTRNFWRQDGGRWVKAA